MRKSEAVYAALSNMRHVIDNCGECKKNLCDADANTRLINDVLVSIECINNLSHIVLGKLCVIEDMYLDVERQETED